jgi:hypothetical protein
MIKIELPQSQYDIASSIATRLNQENVLKEPKLEELMVVTMRILIDEYQENSRSVVTFYMKRKTLDTKINTHRMRKNTLVNNDYTSFTG